MSEYSKFTIKKIINPGLVRTLLYMVVANVLFAVIHVIVGFIAFFLNPVSPPFDESLKWA